MDEHNIDEIMDELAGRKPKQSAGNPIPEKAKKRREEEQQHIQDEREKDYFASQKPERTGGERKSQKTVYEDNESFLTALHASTVQEDVGLSERFPEIHTDAIYLKKGEKCYFSSSVQVIERKTVKDYKRRIKGWTTGDLIPGIRFSGGRMEKEEIGEHDEQDSYFGQLFVTNKRTIFIERNKGFDKRHSSISSILRDGDALRIQYGSKAYFIVTRQAEELEELYERLK